MPLVLRQVLCGVGRAQKKAAAIVEDASLAPTSKLKAIEQVYARARSAKRPAPVVVVSRTAGGKPNVAKGSGGKGGKVKFVDSRMRKDLKSQKRAAKKGKRR